MARTRKPNPVSAASATTAAAPAPSPTSTTALATATAGAGSITTSGKEGGGGGGSASVVGTPEHIVAGAGAAVDDEMSATAASLCSGALPSSDARDSAKNPYCSCGKLPFRMRQMSHSWIDSGLCLFEGLYFHNEDQPLRSDCCTNNGGHRRSRGVAPRTAVRTARRAQRSLDALKKDLTTQGLLRPHHRSPTSDGSCRSPSGVAALKSEGSDDGTPTTSTIDEDYSYSTHSVIREDTGFQSTSSSSNDYHQEESRIVAPLHKSELILGPRLGSGGFANVYEIDAFDLRDEYTRYATPSEQAARMYLQDNPQRITKDELEGALPPSAWLCMPTCRYAVKHLKSSLADDEDKFEKAAIDLALEAQLLQSIDHPHIVRLRGLPAYGAKAFQTGKCDEYFLVLDCIPETLDDRFFTWRQSLRKYKSRSKSWLFNKRKYLGKARNLFNDRLQSAHDLASALEYLHSRRIIYRDLKASNVGIDPQGHIQLYDFGLARLLPPKAEKLQGGYVMSRVGTRSTMAPEVRSKQPYDTSADVYSYGIVLWEILSLATSGEYLRRKRKDCCFDKDDSMKKPTKKKKKHRPQHRQHGNCKDGTTDAGQDQGRRLGSKTEIEAICPDEKEKGQNGEPEGTHLPLPVCPCWSPALQELVVRCLSYDPKGRPTMTEIRSIIQAQLEERGVETGGKNCRRSAFRLDLSGLDAAAKVTAANDSNVDTVKKTKGKIDEIGEKNEISGDGRSKSKRSLASAASTTCVELASFSDRRSS